MVTINPILIRARIRSLALIPIRLASSPTVMVSEILMMRLIAFGMVISVFFPSATRNFSFRLPFAGRRPGSKTRSRFSVISVFLSPSLRFGCRSSLFQPFAYLRCSGLAPFPAIIGRKRHLHRAQRCRALTGTAGCGALARTRAQDARRGDSELDARRGGERDAHPAGTRGVSVPAGRSAGRCCAGRSPDRVNSRRSTGRTLGWATGISTRPRMIALLAVGRSGRTSSGRCTFTGSGGAAEELPAFLVQARPRQPLAPWPLAPWPPAPWPLAP